MISERHAFNFYISLFFVIVFVGCGYGHTATRVKSYTIGQTLSSAVGLPMIVSEDKITMVPKKINRAMGRKEKITNNSSWREELIYTGKSGSVITISYREYSMNMARPAFFQELKYDLDSSSTIVFKNYRLNIIDANNEKIVFVIISE